MEDLLKFINLKKIIINYLKGFQKKIILNCTKKLNPNLVILLHSFQAQIQYMVLKNLSQKKTKKEFFYMGAILHLIK